MHPLEVKSLLRKSNLALKTNGFKNLKLFPRPKPNGSCKKNQEFDNTNCDPRPYFNEGLATPMFK